MLTIDVSKQYDCQKWSMRLKFMSLRMKETVDAIEKRQTTIVDDEVATIRMTLRNHANKFDEFWRIWRSIMERQTGQNYIILVRSDHVHHAVIGTIVKLADCSPSGRGRANHNIHRNDHAYRSDVTPSLERWSSWRIVTSVLLS